MNLNNNVNPHKDFEICILVMLSDQEDVQFAHALASQIPNSINCVIKDYQELVSNTSTISGRLGGVPWVPICVLSKAVMSTPEVIKAIKQMSTDSANGPPRRYYLVCRGINMSNLLLICPELKVVFDELTVINENMIGTLIEDIIAYAQIWKPPWDTHFNLFKSASLWIFQVVYSFSAANFYYIGYLFHIVSVVAIPATFLVAILLMFGVKGLWREITTMILCFSVGYGFFPILHSLDLWPLLGPFWRFDGSELANAARKILKSNHLHTLPWIVLMIIGAVVWYKKESALLVLLGLCGIVLNWLTVLCFSRRLMTLIQIDQDSSGCSEALPEQTIPEKLLLNSLDQWKLMRKMNRIMIGFWACVVAVAAWANPSTFTSGLALVFLLIGFVGRLLWEWSFKLVLAVRARQSGLTPSLKDEIDTSIKMHRIINLDNHIMDEAFKKFSKLDVHVAKREATTFIKPTHVQTSRSLFCRHDYIFISYSWAEERGTAMAERLAEVCTAIDIPFYWDRLHVKSQFLPWRRRVATSIEKCTHFFLVVPRYCDLGTIVHREYEWAVRRWRDSLLPAILCVVEPDIAAELQNDPNTPFFLRLILAWCPHLTYSQADDERLLQLIIKQRRRQGLIKDALVAIGLHQSEVSELYHYKAISAIAAELENTKI
ncbi:hypothetical protein JW935_05195 [candidate division KSB1 bacterium]|nr:hypothetical protein [candidate division KSB1 bacterium]